MILIRLPEHVREVVARPWWDEVVRELLAGLHRMGTTSRALHDDISCSKCAVALRRFNLGLTSREGLVKFVIVSQDRRIAQMSKDEVVIAKEELKPEHRERGATPHPTSRAANV